VTRNSTEPALSFAPRHVSLQGTAPNDSGAVTLLETILSDRGRGYRHRSGDRRHRRRSDVHHRRHRGTRHPNCHHLVARYTIVARLVRCTTAARYTSAVRCT